MTYGLERKKEWEGFGVNGNPEENQSVFVYEFLFLLTPCQALENFTALGLTS